MLTLVFTQGLILLSLRFIKHVQAGRATMYISSLTSGKAAGSSFTQPYD